jgi:hypothetical protein
VGQSLTNWAYGAYVIMLNKKRFHNHTPQKTI